jgi:hypothetical protein
MTTASALYAVARRGDIYVYPEADLFGEGAFWMDINRLGSCQNGRGGCLRSRGMPYDGEHIVI